MGWEQETGVSYIAYRLKSCLDLYKIKYLKHNHSSQTCMKFLKSGIPQIDTGAPPVFGVFAHKIALKHWVAHFVHPPNAHLDYLI